MFAMFLTHWLQYNYLPPHEVWYRAADWPNAMIVLVLGPLGWLWSRTRFWPLNLIHAKLDETLAHHKHASLLLEEMHTYMHTGKPHPRVQARLDAGEHPTPKGPSHA